MKLGPTKIFGVLDKYEIITDIEICNEKKLCVFCHNPFSVFEHCKSKESSDNLFICCNCLKKIRYFKDDIAQIIKSEK